MAIGYKSQGAGVSTETSGAALSPLCPATVDAGDILLAHVFWEGTTDAPSTPSGWELLGSSPYVIETTIARHWLFGRIADGSEDGAAVAFGSPAVTTQRAARIYSFSGRTAGTILELVTGFSHTSHGTDPQMPTVITTEAGNLACAFIGQNDNNSVLPATGESGGDWTEAVAEYLASLTPGIAISLQICTPTADPGTVSGGSAATNNDPVGVIGCQIRAAAAQVVSTGVGAVIATGFAPSVTVTSNQVVTPGVGEAVLTGLVPTAFSPNPQTATPDVGVLVLSGLAPTVAISDNQSAAPGVGAAQLDGLAPSVSVSDNQSAAPGIGAAELAGLAPTVTASDHKTAAPDVGALDLAGFAPTVTVAVNTSAAPGAGVLLAEGFAPDVEVSDVVPVVVPRRRGGSNYGWKAVLDAYLKQREEEEEAERKRRELDRERLEGLARSRKAMERARTLEAERLEAEDAETCLVGALIGDDDE